jgi:hypothetical protein
MIKADVQSDGKTPKKTKSKTDKTLNLERVKNMLLNIDGNAKTVKGQKQGYMTGILYLKPSKKVCPFASKHCLKSCLNTAGRGIMKNVQAGRKRKTDLYFKSPQLFLHELVKDISTLKRRARKAGLIPVVRLNGTSDINFADLRDCHGMNIFELFAETIFYDYTKDIEKALNNQIANYHLTFSASGENESDVLKALQAGLNVTKVYKNIDFLEYQKENYINGDLHDLRFIDKKRKPGFIVALKAKGQARKHENPFIN